MGWWAGRDWGGEATFWPIHPAGVRNIARTLGYRLKLRWQSGSLAVCELWPPAATPAGSDI